MSEKIHPDEVARCPDFAEKFESVPQSRHQEGEAHARLGPSNKRWPKCAGSVREEAQYEDIAGEAAIDGTGSHLLLEMCLQNNVDAAVYDQQIIGANHPDNMNGWLVAPDRIKRVQMALDYITRRVAEMTEMWSHCNVTVESESRSNPGEAFGRDDWWGTCDITIIARHKMTGAVYFIEVADYKDGRMYVSEKDNTQNISYLFGRMRPYITEPDGSFTSARVDDCRMTIIQPKTNPVVRYQCSTRPDDGISVDSVILAAAEMAVAAHATDDPLAKLIPGGHCQWCKANPKRGGHCTAQSDQSLKVVETMSNTEIATGDQNLFEHISKAMADPKSLTEVQLSELADAEAGIQAVFDKVKKEIETRIDQGITVPGYAKLPSNGSNQWNEDDETIAKKLRSRKLKNSDIYPPKLISPAQVMKLDKLNDSQKERIKKELISYIGGKLILKKVAHKVVDEENNAVELMFADVPKTETDEVSFF